MASPESGQLPGDVLLISISEKGSGKVMIHFATAQQISITGRGLLWEKKQRTIF